jgi:hypothetical protein
MPVTARVAAIEHALSRERNDPREFLATGEQIYAKSALSEWYGDCSCFVNRAVSAIVGSSTAFRCYP